MKWLATLVMSAVLLLGIGGCATTGSTPEAQLAQAQTTVYNLQSAYNGVLTVMIYYKRLPSCGTPAATPPLCSKPDTIKQLQTLDREAFEALMAAQDIVRAPGAGLNLTTVLNAATRAMQALTAMTATLPKPQ